MDDDVPPSRPVGALGATFVLATFVLGTLSCLEILVHLIAAVSGQGLLRARELAASRPLFAGIAQAVAAATVLGFAKTYYLPGRRLAPSLGLVPVRSEKLVLAALLGVAMQVPLSELGNVIETFSPVPYAEKLRIAEMLSPRSFADGLGLVLAVVAIAPIAEELVFRGLLMAGIARGSGIGVGITISTLAFAISHGRPHAAVIAFVGGLILAIVAYRTESLLPAIVIHAANNALPVLISTRIRPIAGWNVPSPEPVHLPMLVVVPLSVVSALVFARLVRPDVDHDSPAPKT